MDSLTQITLGMAVGELVLGKKVGNKAMLWGAICGTIPDLDVLANPFLSTLDQLYYHRGMTHSLTFSILLAPIVGWLANAIHKKDNVGWKAWAWLAFWCLFTHPILDAYTTWGTQIFWPFSEHRVAWNVVFVADPLYTLPFLACVIAALFLKRHRPARRWINFAGIALSTSYLSLAVVFKGIAENRFSENLKGKGISYEQLISKPAPLNTVLWSMTAETKDSFVIGYCSLLDPTPFSPVYSVPKNLAMIRDSLDQETYDRLFFISKGLLAGELENGKLVINDLRFGPVTQTFSPSDPFVFSYGIRERDAETGKVVLYQRSRGAAPSKEDFQKLWARISGNPDAFISR